MDSQSPKQFGAEVHTPGRVILLYSEIAFRSVGFKDISEQYHVALNGNEVAEEVECFFENSTWPEEVTFVHKSLLHEKKLDSEMESNAKKTFRIVQPFLAQYDSYYLTQAPLKKMEV